MEPPIPPLLFALLLLIGMLIMLESVAGLVSGAARTSRKASEAGLAPSRARFSPFSA